MATYRWLAAGVDVAHALAMLLWAAGMPLLFWHRFANLSRAYMWFAIAFVGVSLASHAALGECILTRVARALWLAGGGFRDETPFVTVLVNGIAGLRPSDRQVTLLWESAIFVTSFASLWCWRKTPPRRPSHR